MSEKVAVTQSYLQDMADAIREKTGSTATYKPSEMAAGIQGISSGASVDTCTVSVLIDSLDEYDYAVTIFSDGMVKTQSMYVNQSGSRVPALSGVSHTFTDVVCGSIMILYTSDSSSVSFSLNGAQLYRNVAGILWFIITASNGQTVTITEA